MKRILVLGGTWASIVVVAGLMPGGRSQEGLEISQRLRRSRPDVRRRVLSSWRTAQAAAQHGNAAAAAAGGSRSCGSPQARSQRHGRCAARQQNAVLPGRYPELVLRLSAHYRHYSPLRLHSPYGYSYYPPGSTPYALGYDPSTGTEFLYPTKRLLVQLPVLRLPIFLLPQPLSRLRLSGGSLRSRRSALRAGTDPAVLMGVWQAGSNSLVAKHDSPTLTWHAVLITRWRDVCGKLRERSSRLSNLGRYCRLRRSFRHVPGLLS